MLSTLVWDGNGGNGQNTVWSAWSNWNPNVVPQSGDSLTFSGARKLTNWNDLNLSVPNIIIQSGGFNIDGNLIRLGDGGIHFVGGSSANWGIPLAISAAETGIEVYGSRTFYLNDVISGGGGVGKYGVGTAVLNAANTYTGDTKIYWGLLYLGNSAALQGTTLDYNNFGGAVSFGGQTSAVFGGLEGSQNLGLNNDNGAGVTLTVGGNGASTTYAGVLSGPGGLTKIGGGTLTLSAANTYTGATTIDDGTLVVAGSLAASGAAISGGTLAGGGSVQSITLSSGVLAPGDGVGTLTATAGASLTGGTLRLELGDGDQLDQLLVTGGDVTLGSALEFALAGAFSPAPGQVLPLVNNAGPGSTTGAFAGYADGASVTIGGARYTLRYHYDFGGDGNLNDVVLVKSSNSPPAVGANVFSTKIDAALHGQLAATDVDGDPLTYSLVSGPTSGQLALSPDGSFTYTPDTPAGALTATFSFSVSDSVDATTGVATINVQEYPDVAWNGSTLVWDGNGGNGKNNVWSAWSNWNPNRVPNSGDSIVFQGSKKKININDLSLAVPQITIKNDGFNIDGNTITLGSGGLHFISGTNATVGTPFYLPRAGTAIEVASGRWLNLTDILTGPGGISKYGDGVAVLNAASSYLSNTTIHAGTLLVNGSIGSQAIVQGGTLAGGGSVGSLAAHGGIVSPGNGVGTLTVLHGATFDSGGTLAIELNDGVTTDRLVVAGGDVQLGGTLSLSVGGNFHPGPHAVLPLVVNAGSGVTSGVFANHLDGEVLTLGGQQFVLRYHYALGGDGLANDVVLLKANLAPVAAADEYYVKLNQQLVLPAPAVLANDSDPDGDPVTVAPVLLQPPAHGQATVAADGSLVYLPDTDYEGLDTLVYQVLDDHGGAAEGTVTFRVSLNTPPQAGDNSFRIARTVALHSTLHATDAETPDNLTYSLVSGPSSGSLTLNADGSFSFSSKTPGTVHFTFAVSDGSSTIQSTATLTVLAWNGTGIRPDVMEWMLAHNPGLSSNFLKTEPPDKVVLLPSGQSVQIYRLEQFLNVNFQIDLKSRKADHVDFVNRQEEHMRKLMALPEFYHFIKDYSSTYKIGGHGTVSSEEAYRLLRNLHTTVWVTADPRVKTPVGGGGGINGPSWAVWNKMNILFHEVGNATIIGEGTRGLSGPLAGKMDDWDNQRRWDYSTIDLNSLDVPQ